MLIHTRIDSYLSTGVRRDLPDSDPDDIGIGILSAISQGSGTERDHLDGTGLDVPYRDDHFHLLHKSISFLTKKSDKGKSTCLKTDFHTKLHNIERYNSVITISIHRRLTKHYRLQLEISLAW